MSLKIVLPAAFAAAALPACSRHVVEPQAGVPPELAGVWTSTRGTGATCPR